jgi:tetratricopeptide (TPR) repeat protein
MSESFLHGTMLFSQGRLDLAEDQFRLALAEEPDFGVGHAYLAICLLERDQNAEALREADEAIKLEPQVPFIHYARGLAQLAADRPRDAEISAREAILLDPENASWYSLLARAEFVRRRWTQSLEAAEQGLSFDPEHSVCLNVRSMALTQLGRKQEAAETLGSALENDPEDPFTHANQGWVYLHQGDHAKALEHFREALRLEPGNEWARAGIIESLKARHWLYRQMLAFFLWLGRQSAWAQWGVILGLVFGRRILAEVAKSHPEIAPYLMPLQIGLIGFFLLTWIANPLFNFLLQFNRFGRLVLTRHERLEANVIGLTFFAAFFAMIVALATGAETAYIVMIFCALMIPSLKVAFMRDIGPMRRLTIAYAAGVFLLGLPLMGAVLIGPPFTTMLSKETILSLWDYFVLAAVVATWFPAILLARQLGR